MSVKWIESAEQTTFVNHTTFTTPRNAKAGDVHELPLSDGRTVEYVLPDDTVPGEEHVVRVASGLTKTEVTILMKQTAGRLGLSLTEFGNGKFPVVTETKNDGAASGKLLCGDVVLSVSDSELSVDARSRFDTNVLLLSACCKLNIEVLRPMADTPTRVLYSACLHKRSPQAVLGVQAWQRRWFEIDAEKITYWEIETVGGRSFLGEAKGRIILTDIAGVRLAGNRDPKDAASGRLIDVLMKQSHGDHRRMYQLRADDKITARAFAQALIKAQGCGRSALL